MARPYTKKPYAMSTSAPIVHWSLSRVSFHNPNFHLDYISEPFEIVLDKSTRDFGITIENGTETDSVLTDENGNPVYFRTSDGWQRSMATKTGADRGRYRQSRSS